MMMSSKVTIFWYICWGFQIYLRVFITFIFLHGNFLQFHHLLERINEISWVGCLNPGCQQPDVHCEDCGERKDCLNHQGGR